MNAPMIQESIIGDIPIVVCAADNNYSMPMAVMLRSMVENLRSYPRISLWILDGGISRRNRRRIQSSVPEGFVEFNWIRPSRRELKGFPVSGHTSICAYYRLLMAELLPRTIHKAIYLDADILVLGDIGELWNMDPGVHSILAFAEQGRKVSDACALSMYAELGLSSDAPYFNSGILVVNLDLWRRKKLFRVFTMFIEKYANMLNFWDQDVLNGVLAHAWGRLDEKWNSRVHNLWEKDRLDREIEGMAIIHFASSVKPWTFGAHHAAESLYFQWVDKTAWVGWRPVKPWVDWVAVGRSLRNKHWYGQWIRRIPVIGGGWRGVMAWRQRMARHQEPS